MELSVYYFDDISPIDRVPFTRDEEVIDIVGQEPHSRGTWLETSERDMQFTVDEVTAQRVAKRLRARGFKVMLRE